MICQPNQRYENATRRASKIKGVLLYKVVRLTPDGFVSSIIGKHIWKPGRNIARIAWRSNNLQAMPNGTRFRRSRIFGPNDVYDPTFPCGFHVFRHKRNADTMRQEMTRDYAILPVTCSANFLVAADQKQAAFREVNVAENDWVKLIMPRITKRKLSFAKLDK